MGNLERAKNITTMEKLVQGTVQNSTSGTSIDFTGIPSWAKRITVMFNGVSTSGASQIQVQLGTSGGVVTTGYVSSISYGTSAGVATTGLLCVYSIAAASTIVGNLSLFNQYGNNWMGTCVVGGNSGNIASIGGGSVTLSGTLDRIRITTVNGTDVFDAGQINIMYEG